MDIGIVIAIGVAVVIAIIGIAVVSRRVEKQRREACRALATQHGWTYTEEDPAYINRWDGAPFSAGHGRKAVNVITGEHRGRRFVMFEHRHRSTSSNGQQTTTRSHWHTIYVVALPASVPALELKPRGLFSGIADLFGVQDIEVGQEEFDKRVRVRGDDEQYARLFLSGGGITHAVLDLGDLQLRVIGAELLAVESGRQITEFGTARLDQLTALVGMIPGTIWSQYSQSERTGAE